MPIVSPEIAATAVICFIFSWIELLLADHPHHIVAQTARVISLPVLIDEFAAQD